MSKPEMNKLQCRQQWLAFLLLMMLLAIAGCSDRSGTAAPDGADQQVVRQPVEAGKLKLGFSGNSALIGLKARGDLEAKLATLPPEQSSAVEWLSFKDDASLLRAIEEGRVDIGAVGDAVPTFLHREAATLVYLAAEPANPSAYAIAVPLDSDIFTAADLRGKRVAYPPFSNEHLLLLLALESAGLTATDVKPVAVAPADTEDTLAARKADAWVVGEPELSRIEPLGIRIITDGTLSPAQRDIYISTPESMADREALFELAIGEISAYDDWLGAEIHDAAELLFNHTGILHAGWLASFERKTYGTAPFLPSIVGQEEQIAAAVQQLGGRKNAVNIQDFIHTP
ncbi:hypothetical protein EBB07_07525 [Paenibacillaceae bacterium]|nr:hypothetical protein EBB07_07525 [Paenibacillaceae bacterium]